MAVATGTALIAAATAASAGASIFGASKAAGAQKDASAANAAIIREMFAKAEGHLQPWMTQGLNASGMYMGGLMGGDAARSAFDQYKKSVGYESTLAAGTDALNTNAANRNLLNSGSTLKNVTKFGQDLNMRHYDSWLGRLAYPMGLGASSAQSLAGMGMNAAGMHVQNNNNLADAQGNAWLYGTSALSSGLRGMGGLFGGGGGGNPAGAMSDWRGNYGGFGG